MKDKEIIMGICPAIGIFVLDEYIKQAVENGEIKMPNAAVADGRKILKEKVVLRRLHNKGAARGVGKKTPETIKNISIALTTMAFTYLMCELDGARSKKPNVKRSLKTLGLAMLLGGSLSNTKDRINRGYVVDYFSPTFGPESIKDLVFNISDMAIMCGAGLAAGAYILEEKK